VVLIIVSRLANVVAWNTGHLWNVPSRLHYISCLLNAPELKTASASRKELANKPVMGCMEAARDVSSDRFSRHYVDYH
jgi:hypothetical protein